MYALLRECALSARKIQTRIVPMRGPFFKRNLKARASTLIFA